MIPTVHSDASCLDTELAFGGVHDIQLGGRTFRRLYWLYTLEHAYYQVRVKTFMFASAHYYLRLLSAAQILCLYPSILHVIT